MEDRSHNRLRILSRILAFWVVLIISRLVYLQVLHHDDLRREAERQQSRVQKVAPVRGAILDRNGQALAMSLPVDSVCVNPLRIPDPSVAAAILARTLDLDAEGLEKRIRDAAEAGNGFIWVKRKIDPEQSKSLRSMNLDWIEFRPDTRRFYPQGSLAPHVVGYVAMNSRDREYEHGAGGVELTFEKTLFGEPGEMQVFTDVRQNAYDVRITKKPVPGGNIRLTIDTHIQYVAERALMDAVKQHRADSGAVVVARPNGELLAVASVPLFDPNIPPTKENMGDRFNFAVNAAYEPGSIFKMFTFASAFETTRLQPSQYVPINYGTLKIGKRTIRDSHAGPAGMSMAEVLQKSSNVGAIWVANQVGEKAFRDYVKAFGFGQETGLPLPGEVTGVVHDKEWKVGDLASVAMGYYLQVNTIQLAMAMSVIANGGILPKPELILPASANRLPQGKRVIKPETSILMRQLLEEVVLKGTGKLARLHGWTSGGKTGTAKRVTEHGQYASIYNASFVGFAPVTNPAVVIAVTLHGTKDGNAGFGGPAAAPVFREVAETALRVLEIPKDLRDDKIDYSKEISVAESVPGPDAMLGQEPVVISSITQPPAPELLARPGSQNPGDRRTFSEDSGPRVPNFKGLSMRAVLEQSMAEGIPVALSGSGVARAQTPEPGTILPAGERVHIQLAR